MAMGQAITAVHATRWQLVTVEGGRIELGDIDALIDLARPESRPT